MDGDTGAFSLTEDSISDDSTYSTAQATHKGDENFADTSAAANESVEYITLVTNDNREHISDSLNGGAQSSSQQLRGEAAPPPSDENNTVLAPPTDTDTIVTGDTPTSDSTLADRLGQSADRLNLPTDQSANRLCEAAQADVDQPSAAAKSQTSAADRSTSSPSPAPLPPHDRQSSPAHFSIGVDPSQKPSAYPDQERPRSQSTPKPSPINPGRKKHLSGNPPGVRGIIIESTKSRENSPNRSPGLSPGFLGDRVFVLPPEVSPRPGGLPATSVSDYSIHSGGAGSGGSSTSQGNSSETGTRPKTTPRPVSDRRSLQKRGSGRFRRLSGGSGSIQLQLQRRRREVSGRESFTDDESLSESSQEVVDQSEEIMQNFMFERYNRDMRSPEKSFTLPRSPGVIENFSPSPTTNISAIGRRLATIGDEIDARYSREFAQMTRSLNITQGAMEEAYDAFRGVAMRLFQQGVMSMGKIVALLQFGYRLAMDVLSKGIGDFMSDIIKWLIRFISVEKIKNAASHTYQSIAEWIASRGGWQAAAETLTDIGSTLTDSSFYVVAAFGVICVSLIGIAYYFRHK